MEDLERLAKLDPNNNKTKPRLSIKSNTKPKQPTDSKVDTLPKCLHKNVENDSDDGRFSETDGEDEGVGVQETEGVYVRYVSHIYSGYQFEYLWHTL